MELQEEREREKAWRVPTTSLQPLSAHPPNVIPTSFKRYPVLPSHPSIHRHTEPLFFPRTTTWQPRRLGLMGYASGEVLIALTPLHPSEADPGHMTTILQSEEAMWQRIAVRLTSILGLITSRSSGVYELAGWVGL